MEAMLDDQKESREFPAVEKLHQKIQSAGERLKYLNDNPPVISASPSPPPRIVIEDVKEREEQKDEQEKKYSPSIVNKFARFAKKIKQRSDGLAAIEEDETNKNNSFRNWRNEAIMRHDDDLMRDRFRIVFIPFPSVSAVFHFLKPLATMHDLT